MVLGEHERIYLIEGRFQQYLSKKIRPEKILGYIFFVTNQGNYIEAGDTSALIKDFCWVFADTQYFCGL
jgi:hypothetical protein